MVQRIQKNFPFIFILPSANVILLQVWAPSMHNLVDGLFILWDFVVYLGLGALTIALSANVIFSQSPIRSLFSLIGVFICAILLFLSIRVEFLSMIFLIVYIGAIAILFLFVIMLLNLKKAMPSGSRAFLANWANPVFFLFLSERGYVFLSSAVYVNSYYNSRSLAGHSNVGLSELNQINYYMRYGLSDASIFSDLFYSVHGFIFLATACVLAVSMIGSIILALSTSESGIDPRRSKVNGFYFLPFFSAQTNNISIEQTSDTVPELSLPSNVPETLSLYSSFYENLTPLKMVTILTITVALSYLVFRLSQNKLPIKDDDLKIATSLLLSILFANGNVHFVLSQIPLYKNFTAYNGLIFLVVFYVVSRFLLDKSFRETILKILMSAYENFIVAVEGTVQLHFGSLPPPIGHYLFFIFYFIIITVIAAYTEMCFLRPWLARSLFVFALVGLAQYTYCRFFDKKDYSSQKFVARLLYGSILVVLNLTIFTNTTFFAVLLFFALILLCYLHGYGSMVPAMEQYREMYVKAIPKIESLDPFTRLRVKYLNWCITVFPLFLSPYFQLLVYSAAVSVICIATASRLETAWANNAETARLFLLLFLAVQSFLLFLVQQNLGWKFLKKEKTVIYLLINLTSHEAVCDIVGNNPAGRAATAGGQQAWNAFKVIGPSFVFGGTVVVAEQEIEGQRQNKINTSFQDQLKTVSKYFPNGEVPVPYQREIYQRTANQFPKKDLFSVFKQIHGHYFGGGGQK